MPKQYTFLGRPIPRFSVRRLTLLLFGLSVLALTLIATLTNGVPTPPSLSAYDPKITVPRLGDKLSKGILNPFRQPSHKPPRQKHDEFAGSSWWADWRWLSIPFSSSLTLDEDRAMLPPLRERQPIYCYYDATIKKTRDEKEAESALLLTWRRAWWAQGFWPVILSASEAMNNPTYEILQRSNLNSDLREDLMKWLAWERMGGGVLSEATLLPTVPHEDTVLTFLRRGEYPKLARWQDLGKGLIAGQESDIKKAIDEAMIPTNQKLKSVVETTPDSWIDVDTSPSPLAYYSPDILLKHYNAVADSIEKNRAKGLVKLNQLINSHLHVAWQNRFSNGIEVPNPYPKHTSIVTKGVMKIANYLISCPESPIPDSCPPNLPKCTLCNDKQPMTISTSSGYHNSTGIFTLGVVPHPWTLAVLENNRDSLNVTWIRRESPRDPWLTAVTNDLVAKTASESRRVLRLKDAVAGQYAAGHSLWFAAEADMPDDLGWRFGFAVPKTIVESDTLPAFHAGDDKTEKGTGSEDSADIAATDISRFEHAKKVVAQVKSTGETKLRASLEAWNMADTEVWKFIRAYSSRQQLERTKWEKGEEKYSNGAGTEKGRTALNRWQDQKAA